MSRYFIGAILCAVLAPLFAWASVKSWGKGDKSSAQVMGVLLLTTILALLCNIILFRFGT
jgi:hypothetical protein